MSWIDLMSLVKEAVQAGRSMPLEVIWKVAGSPEQVSPRTWIKNNPHHNPHVTVGSKQTIAEAKVVWQYVWALYPFRKASEF